MGGGNYRQNAICYYKVYKYCEKDKKRGIVHEKRGIVHEKLSIVHKKYCIVHEK